MRLKKNVKIAIGVVVAVVGVALAIKLLNPAKPGNDPEGKESASENTNNTGESSAENGKDEKNENGEENNPEGENGEKNDSDENGSEQNGKKPSESTPTPKPTAKPTPKPENTKVTLPYTIPGSSLVIQSIQSYDGQFLEDGSDAKVSGIATAVIKNTGKNPVEYVDVEIKSGSKKYRFKGSAIASGAYIVIQDMNKTKYNGGSYSNCTAHVADMDSFEVSKDVNIEEQGDTLKVTNVSKSDIPCVRIFYKLYMEDQNAYLGGITYTSKITDLKAGETINITPSHFQHGYSKILMVRTYDSAD